MARKLKPSMTAMASRMACTWVGVKASGVMVMAWPDLPLGSGVRMVPVLATKVGVPVLSSRSALALASLG